MQDMNKSPEVTTGLNVYSNMERVKKTHSTRKYPQALILHTKNFISLLAGGLFGKKRVVLSVIVM